MPATKARSAKPARGARKKPEKTFQNVPISSALHRLLKAKAREEGRFLYGMVEEALWPLVRPQVAPAITPFRNRPVQ